MQTLPIRKRLLSRYIAAFSLATASAPLLAQDNAALLEMEEVVVLGIRGSQQAAVDVKRNSVNIIDSIVAEDIGKLPDVTIADSLQRVTGVQIQREAGEGTSLNIRGMPQVLTTLNGEQFLSPWTITNVGANYSDIPAAMVGAVDVIKSQTASTAPGGISGVVDLKTRRPYTLEQGWTFSANAEASKGSITENTNDSVNLFLGWNGDSVGFTLAAFHSGNNLANYEMSSDLRLAFVNEGGDPYDFNDNGNLEDRILVPGNYGVKAYVMERERDGLAGSFSADLSDSLFFTADVFYTKMDQVDRAVESRFNGANNESYDVLRPGTRIKQQAIVPASGDTPERTLHSLNFAVIEAPDFMATTSSRQAHTEALNSNFELLFDNGGDFTGTLRFVHAQAEQVSEQATFKHGSPQWLYIDENGDGTNDYVAEPHWVAVDFSYELPAFGYSSDLTNAENLRRFQANANGGEADATLNVVRADGSYRLDFADFNSLDFGLRFGRRDVESTSFVYMTPTGRYPGYASTGQQPVAEENRYQPLPGDYVWQEYPDWYSFEGNANLEQEPFENLKSQIINYNDFGPFKGWEEGVAALDPNSLDNIEGFMTSVYPGTRKFNNPARAYEVTEDEISAYVQANFESDSGLWNMPYSGNFGLRVVETQREVVNAVYPEPGQLEEGTFYGGGYPATYGEPEGWQVLYKTLGTETAEASFTNFLPSVNFNIFPQDDVIVRFSYNRTMARNDLASIGQAADIWYQQQRVYTDTGSYTDSNGDRYKIVSGPGGGDDLGNPDLEPWLANNYNLAAEWYFGSAGILGLGVFMIDLEQATQVVQEQRSYPDSDGVVRRSANVWTTAPVDAADLIGFELGYKQAFDFLPSVLADTGMEFNYTYSDNESGETDFEGNSFPLPSNSEHQANLILWYQGDKLSSRIAYNWRSDVYQGQAGLNTNEAPISLGNWTEAAGYLDVSVNYDINENFTVYGQGTNLTETNNYNYAQFSDQFYSVNVQERRVAIGARVRF